MACAEVEDGISIMRFVHAYFHGPVPAYMLRVRTIGAQVDLAGSERVHKTQTAGQTLVEAKHINVSLFFLEMVIVALHERGTKGR